ncbi:MAG: SDR family oxidoreductase [Aphanothece sp. CMT-3BRIN-NPC111]|jgi:nucleoside-diphosphate-sugar epimerase|nr:SDR family oxidoreductase [Aphanothece sp. CMT-3BRIN-NPC111]
MNIAIIGCGYVGTALARHWHQNNSHIITATTTTKERVAQLERVAHRVVVMKGDDFSALRSVVQNQDAVILSVAPTSDRQIAANLYEETYLRTARNLVAALQQAPSVKQLIYTGSYSVYGDRNGAWVDEESPVAPANSNGRVLCDTEQVLLEAGSQNLRVCILRLGGIYGPGRELVNIFSRFFGTTRSGNGENFTNWIHLDDIVSAVTFALLNHWQGIYNLVNDVPLITRELLERLSERHHLPPVLWEPSDHEVKPYNAIVSNHKIKAAGYSLIHPKIIL